MVPTPSRPDGGASRAGQTKAAVARSVVRGLKGGLIATAVMTLYRLPIFRSLPPTAEFWARYVGGGEAEDHLLAGVVLHFLYGTVAGCVFGLLFARIDFGTVAARRRRGVLYGLIYGVFLSVIGTQFVFDRLLDEGLTPDETLVFHVGHVVYGLTLGTWLGSREQFGQVYE